MLFKGSYNLLLWALLLLFILRPYDRGIVYEGIWKFTLLAVLVGAIFNCNHSKTVQRLILALAIPTWIFSWTNLLFVEELVFVLKAVTTILFMLVCTSSIIYDVLLRARVTIETLRGVICAYFMVAFAFAYMYCLIEYVSPGSIQLTNIQVTVGSFAHYLSEMLYFSFITLLTIGFGDIAPASDVAQTATVIEGMIGQFYIAILVARLVSVYSFVSDKRLRSAFEKQRLVKGSKKSAVE
ncbi:MAG: potassium channel family protein [Rhabdochlamydiaceae bacterium]|jgi:hypothetical protein